MPADQIATLRSSASALRSNAAMLRADREGAGNIRWAGEKIAAAGLETVAEGAVCMIRASLKAYDQGNDRVAASHADAAAGRLDALCADAPAAQPTASAGIRSLARSGTE